jgi:hypothetical protein
MQDTTRADAYLAKLNALTPAEQEAYYAACDRARQPNNTLEEYATATNGTRMNLGCAVRILERRLEAAGMMSQVLHPNHPEPGSEGALRTIGDVIASMHNDLDKLSDDQQRIFTEVEAGKQYPERVPYPTL